MKEASSMTPGRQWYELQQFDARLARARLAPAHQIASTLLSVNAPRPDIEKPQAKVRSNPTSLNDFLIESVSSSKPEAVSAGERLLRQ
jgi:hypothetical protein